MKEQLLESVKVRAMSVGWLSAPLHINRVFEMAVSVVLGCKGPALPLLVSLHCVSWSFAPTALRRSCLPLVRMHPSAHSQVHQKTSVSPW